MLHTETSFAERWQGGAVFDRGFWDDIWGGSCVSMLKMSTQTLQTKTAVGDIEIWGGWSSGNSRVQVTERFVLKEAWDFGKEQHRPLPLLQAGRSDERSSRTELLSQSGAGRSLASAAIGSATAAGLLLAATFALGLLRRGRVAVRLSGPRRNVASPKILQPSSMGVASNLSSGALSACTMPSHPE